MLPRDLVTAWTGLIALSIGTVLLASLGTSAGRGSLVAAGVLALAGVKARVILARYLGLSCSRFWTRCYDLALTMFLALAFALYAFGSGR